MSTQSIKPLVTTISNLVADRIGLMSGKALQDAIEEVGGDDLGALVRALETSDTSSPAWQAIVPELVSRKDLPAAMTLTSVAFNVSRAVGPAIGGFLVAI